MADTNISPLTIEVAWNVGGDPRNARLIDALARMFSVTVPLIPNTIAGDEKLTALWLGPRSWLLVAQHRSTALSDFNARRAVLNAAGGALFDVSASRVAYSIAGRQAATILASGCPLDLRNRAFPADGCAQSVFGRVNALIYRVEDGFVLMVARSFAADVAHALEVAAKSCAAAAAHNG